MATVQQESLVAESRLRPVERWASWITRGYVFLLTLAGLGFAGAQAGGFLAAISGLVLSGDTASQPMTWAPLVSQIGWWIGSALGIAAAVRNDRRWRGKTPWFQVDSKRLGSPSPIAPAVDSKSRESVVLGAKPKRESLGRRFKSVIIGTLGIGFAGGLLGGMFGGTLLLIWMWWALSPWAPGGWLASLEWIDVAPSESPVDESAVGTKHPLALGLVGIPVAVGLVLGAVLGGILSWFGESRHTWRR